MTTVAFITDLFCRIDDAMTDAKKHSQANLYHSEVVTIAISFAPKGVGNRAFYRWLQRDYLGLFPKLPHRTRLFRLFNTHRRWTQCFMADHTLIGLMDTYGIELIHPRREGRSEKQIGKKGLRCASVATVAGGGPVIDHRLHYPPCRRQRLPRPVPALRAALLSQAFLRRAAGAGVEQH